MFDTVAGSDATSNRTTRRAFFAGAGALVASSAVLYLRRAPGVEASTVMHGTPGMVTIASFTDAGQALGVTSVAKIVRTDGEWYKQLGKNSFSIARQADTEMAYTGVSWDEHRRGVFRCVCCRTALFASQTKYDSGTGWPSFYQPIAKENIAEKDDRSLLEARTEVLCARCDAHLGHVFNDGPEPTGLRFCMNSASLQFVPG